MAAVQHHAGWKLDESVAWIIFTELITNAMRYAPGPVRVSLECENKSTFLIVADEGPGFEFKPKLPSGLDATKGRGLFVVSHFADDVRVERLPGAGSRVVVKLPTQAAS
jgi:anti-sigma regulatory factor (Ser/Thr protein kinase)